MLPKVFNKLILAKPGFAAFIVLFSFFQSNAQGNLLVTPKRVVFEGSKRSEELNLANIGKDSATYDISFIQIRMKDDGTVENITEPDSAQNFADKYLRFFPRTVTLAPNEAQTVKVQIKNSDQLTNGEYRSHLYFRAVPNDGPLGENTSNKDSGISVKLIPIFGISMPVIIRVGESNASITLSDLAVTEIDKTPGLKLTFTRKGNMSVYGDLLVDYISSQGKTTRVGMAKGLAVYTPNAIRNFYLPLNNNIDYHSGKLHVIYADQSGKENKMAEEYLILH